MTPMSDSQVEQRVAAVFGGNHVPPRDVDKSTTEELEAQPTEELEAETDTPEETAPITDEDLSEEARREETADRLRQADYTRKTMALAAERKAWEAQKAQEAQELEDLRAVRDRLQNDPEFQADFVQAWQKEQAAQGQRPSSESAILRQMAARLNANEQEMAAIREDRFVGRLDAEQRAVAVEFGMTVAEVQTFTAQLIAEGKLSYTTPPDSINDILGGRVGRAKAKTARVDGQKDLVNQIKAGRRAPSVVPSGKTPKPKELSDSDIAKMSEAEFRAFIKKEAGKT